MRGSKDLNKTAFAAEMAGGGREGRLKQAIAANNHETSLNLNTLDGQATAWWSGGILKAYGKLALKIAEFRTAFNGVLRSASPTVVPT